MPQLSVRSESGRFAAEIPRIDCDKKDGWVGHCGVVGNGEVDSRHVRVRNSRASAQQYNWN